MKHKRCILLSGLQGSPKVVAKRLKLIRNQLNFTVILKKNVFWFVYSARKRKKSSNNCRNR